MFLKSSNDEFKAFLVKAIRQNIWNTLSQEMCQEEPRRKDMSGFGQYVNLAASMIGMKPPKSKFNVIPARLWKQLHLTVVTGATVAGDRMAAMGHVHSDECPLCASRHTTDHLFWHCKAYDAVRRPLHWQASGPCN